jgi:hypothetical protein
MGHQQKLLDSSCTEALRNPAAARRAETVGGLPNRAQRRNLRQRKIDFELNRQQKEGTDGVR